jgi:hypothetical protein
MRQAVASERVSAVATRLSFDGDWLAAGVRSDGGVPDLSA